MLRYQKTNKSKKKKNLLAAKLYDLVWCHKGVKSFKKHLHQSLLDDLHLR